jgi:hypothetical protein
MTETPTLAAVLDSGADPRELTEDFTRFLNELSDIPGRGPATIAAKVGQLSVRLAEESLAGEDLAVDTPWLLECAERPGLVGRLKDVLTIEERDVLDPRPYRAGTIETDDVCTYCGRQPEGNALVIDNRPHSHDMETPAVLCADCAAFFAQALQGSRQ